MISYPRNLEGAEVKCNECDCFKFKYVSVDNPTTMGVFHRSEHHGEYFFGVRLLKCHLIESHQVSEVYHHQFHDYVYVMLVLVRVQDLHDVRVM